VFLEPEVGERHARRAERVGLDDVGPGFEVGGMNAPDRVPLRQGQRVDAVFEVAVMTGKPLPAKASLVEAQLVDHGPHGAVEDGDAGVEDGAKQVGTGREWGLRHR
jgi:hypothetical protein